MKTLFKSIGIPPEWAVEHDFVISAIGDSWLSYGVTDGMLIFIKIQEKYEHNDIVAITSKNWINPILKKVQVLSDGQIIFTSPKGNILEKNKYMKILGKIVFKMDNPYKNELNKQLDFWN